MSSSSFGDNIRTYIYTYGPQQYPKLGKSILRTTEHYTFSPKPKITRNITDV